MPSETREIKRILDRHQSHLISHRDAILTGAIRGVKKGGASGGRRGAWDGLKGCLSQELMSVGGVAIADIASIVSRLAISGNVTRAVGPAIEDSIKAYLGEVGTGIIGLRLDQRPGVDAVIQFVRQRHEAIAQWMMDRLPRNPISRGIAVGIRSALEEGLKSSVQTFRARVSETPERQREDRRREETGQAAEVLRNTVENVVAKVVEDVAYELARNMTRRVLNNLMRRLKAKEIQKLENTLGKISQSEFEKGMSKATGQLAEELSKDHPDETSLLKGIDSSFGTSYGKYLSSLANRFPVVRVALGIIAILIISIVVYATFANNGADNGGPTEQPPAANEPPVVVITLVGEEIREVEGALRVIIYRDVELSGENSWDPDGEIVSHHWDFGDNTTSDLEIPEKHTFTADVIYVITLTVTDDSGARGEARLTVGE